MATKTDADDTSTDELTTVEYRNQLRDRLMDDIKDYKLTDSDGNTDKETEAFMERALREIVEHLASNASGRGIGSPAVSDYEEVEEMFDEVGVKEVDVRANGQYAAPKVTVWLGGHPPMWGNTATNTEFKYSAHRPHYNGKDAMAIIDVRPF